MASIRTKKKQKEEQLFSSSAKQDKNEIGSSGFISNKPFENETYKPLIAKSLAQKKGKQSIALEIERTNLEWDRKYQQLLKDNRNLQQQIELLQHSKRKMQITFERKETTYKEEIDQLNLLTQNQKHHLKDLHSMHKEILNNVSSSQQHTQHLIQQSNKSLIIGFENEINHLKTEIESLKQKQQCGNDEFELKTKELKQENTWLKQIATTIEKDNARLKNENIDYMQQISTLESDREFLINQVIAVKRENKHLQILLIDHQNSHMANSNSKSSNLSKLLRPSSSSITAITSISEDPMSARQSSARQTTSSKKLSRKNTKSQSVSQTPLKSSRKRLARPQSAVSIKTNENVSLNTGKNSGAVPITDGIDLNKHQAERQMSIIESLQKQLESEKKKSKQLQYTLNKELATKSDLQSFLQQAFEDVKQEIIEQTANESHQKFLRTTVRSSHHATPNSKYYNTKYRSQRKKDQFQSYSARKRPISVSNIPKSFLNTTTDTIASMDGNELHLDTDIITNEIDDDSNKHVRLQSTKKPEMQESIQPSSTKVSYQFAPSQNNTQTMESDIGSLNHKKMTNNSVSMTTDSALFKKFGIEETSIILRKLLTKEKVLSFLYHQLFGPNGSNKKKTIISHTTQGQSIEKTPLPSHRQAYTNKSATNTHEIDDQFEQACMQNVYEIVDSSFAQ